MVFINLTPIGFMQLKEAFVNGYWSSRTNDFLQLQIVQDLLLWRSVPDTIFLIGVVMIVAFCIKVMFHLRKPEYEGGDTLPDDGEKVNPIVMNGISTKSSNHDYSQK